jgi:hypothetical protein
MERVQCGIDDEILVNKSRTWIARILENLFLFCMHAMRPEVLMSD